MASRVLTALEAVSVRTPTATELPVLQARWTGTPTLRSSCRLRHTDEYLLDLLAQILLQRSHGCHDDIRCRAAPGREVTCSTSPMAPGSNDSSYRTVMQALVWLDLRPLAAATTSLSSRGCSILVSWPRPSCCIQPHNLPTTLRLLTRALYSRAHLCRRLLSYRPPCSPRSQHYCSAPPARPRKHPSQTWLGPGAASPTQLSQGRFVAYLACQLTQY